MLKLLDGSAAHACGLAMYGATGLERAVGEVPDATTATKINKRMASPIPTANQSSENQLVGVGGLDRGGVSESDSEFFVFIVTSWILRIIGMFPAI